MCHNYWACALEFWHHNYWFHVPQLLKLAHSRACVLPATETSHCNEKPTHHNRYSSTQPRSRQWYCLRLGHPGRWPGPSVCGSLCPAYQKLVVLCSFEPLEAPLLSWLISPLAMGLPTAWEPFLFFRSFLFSPFALLVTWRSFLSF